LKRKYTLLILLGFQLPAYIFAGLLVGYLLERQFPFHGILLTFGAFMGVGTWFFQMVKSLNRGDKEDDQNSSGEA
jgi:hypothetical protein